MVYDLLVIGAGPAGSVCAMHAAKAGLKVLLVDKAKFPRFKSCGGALSKRTHRQLGPKAKLGVNCNADGLVVWSPGLKAADYEEPNCLDLVVRTEWDHKVLMDAADSGAEVLEATMAKTVSKNGDKYKVSLSSGNQVSCRYLVIGDGAGLRSYKKSLGFQQPYDHMARTVCAEIPLDDSIIDETLGTRRKIHIFFGVVPRGYGWLFPKRGHLNVGIGFGNASAPSLTQFEVFDRFVTQLKEKKMVPSDCDFSCRVAHPIPFKKPFEPIGSDSALLIGDAGGFVSPVTGEGLYYGTASGLHAAQAISAQIDGTAQVDLVSDYTSRWMADFGTDMIHSGLWLANFVYRSQKRMELMVRMMIADEKTRRTAARMIMGIASYSEARSRILKRALLSAAKSLSV
ncbi:MAG: geranylgeranyl reductase family protein [Candidatus Thorarchaeota archaeon]|nr:geranylgeranyl reductase family protein [Candidatus Thorarchaeota archaeon]